MKIVIFSFVLFSIFNWSKLQLRDSHKLNEEHVRYQGYNRSFYLHVPEKENPKNGFPLVIFLHGYGGNGKNGLNMGHWIEKSNAENFIAAGLNGILKHPHRRESFLFNKKSWDCGGEDTPAEQKGIDDVGFIDTVINLIESQYPIDKSMIYISGFSNGAAMTFRAGMELSSKIAAIAPVSSVLLIKAKPLKLPVSLLLIYGTDDPLNPFNGGTVKRFGKMTKRISAEECWTEWGKLLKCTQKPVIIYDKDGVKGEKLGPGWMDSEAEFFIVDGMGHAWPGGNNRLPRRIIGNTSNKINATDLIWNFFKDHPKKGLK